MRALLLVAISLGCLIHAYVLFFKAKDSSDAFFIGVFLYSIAPYAVAGLLAWFRRTAGLAAGFALGALLGDLWAYYVVFIEQPGRMAGYLLLVVPALNLIILGPLGALLAWACKWFIKKRGESAAADSPAVNR